MILAPLSARAAEPPIVAKHVAIFDKPPQHVPTPGMVDGPLLGNGDVGVVLAGPPEAQQFHLGKNDFWRRHDASIMAVGSIRLDAPALAGASYHQEQDMAHGEVRGTFSKDLLTVRTRSWVSAEENLLVTSLRCEGSTPVAFVAAASGGTGGRSGSTVGRQRPARQRRTRAVRQRPLVLRRLDRGLADRAASLFRRGDWPAGQGAADRTGPKRFDGRSTFEALPRRGMDQAVTVAAWIKIEGVDKDANYIVSKGEWNQAYSLGLSSGCLRWAIGDTYLQTETTAAAPRMGPRGRGFRKQTRAGVVRGWCAQGGARRFAAARSSERRPPVGSPAAPTRCPVAARSPWSRGSSGRRSTRQRPDGLQFTLKPGGAVVLASVVRSDLDDKDFLAAAKKRAAELTVNEIDAAAARHAAWWSKFWARSFIEIPDKEIERRWYAALYVMASCSRRGKGRAGTVGQLDHHGSPAWHGDFHLNYNFQAPYYIVYSSNHADLSLPFYQAIWQSVPNGRAMAQRHGWKGVHFPVSIGPWGLSPENPDGDWGQRSNAAFAALNFIWHYQYTQDVEFLRTTAYPYLREVAEFWEDYLKFENGRYVIYSDSIHEGSGPDMNPLLSLGLLRTLFRNLVSMSEDLGVDADRRAKWRHIWGASQRLPLAGAQRQDRVPLFREGHGLVRQQHARHPPHLPRRRHRPGQRSEAPGNLPQHDRRHGPLARRQRVLLVVHGLCPRRLRSARPSSPGFASSATVSRIRTWFFSTEAEASRTSPASWRSTRCCCRVTKA